MVEEQDYGEVLITKGDHKGKIGYYDDDDWEDDFKAVVYFGEPFRSPAYLISRIHMVPANTKMIALEKFKRDNPIAYKQMGVISR